MEIIEISPQLIQFRFLEKMDRVSYYTSAFLWHRDDMGILIDTGYLSYAEKILEYLKSHGYKIEYTIITHYHRDHAEGSLILPTKEIIASRNYKSNFDKCQNFLKHNFKYPKPTQLVDQVLTFNWLEDVISIYATPGHTPCSISVIINGTFLFVSDLILEDIDGKVIIPYIDLNSDPHKHLSSLRLLERLQPKHIILTHGANKFHVQIQEMLIDRIYYLERFIEYNFDINIEGCLLYDVDHYAMLDIHKLNIRNAKKLAK